MRLQGESWHPGHRCAWVPALRDQDRLNQSAPGFRCGTTAQARHERALERSDRSSGHGLSNRPSTHSLAAQWDLDWRPGRVYFLTLLEPSRDDRTLALTARSASRLP